MATDLKKMISGCYELQLKTVVTMPEVFFEALLAMAEQIEANTKNINESSKICQNLALTCEILSERIDLLRKEPKP